MNIVQFSGGKDSTCMLLMMLENNIPVDEIIFCDTGMEFPQMYEHIRKVEEYISSKYGKTITVLKPEKSFEYYLSEYTKSRGKYTDVKGFGWATPTRNSPKIPIQTAPLKPLFITVFKCICFSNFIVI